MEKKIAVIYSRVSTEDQVANTSLASQEQECTQFAERNGYGVQRVFREEGESAKTTDRTKLKEMLGYIRQKNNHVDAVIVWKLDRFTRSVADYHILKIELDRYGVMLLSATEPNEMTPIGNFVRNVSAAHAQLDNEVRAERTVKGMRAAVREGRYVSIPPLGYRMGRDSRGKPLLEVTEDSRFIKYAFEQFLSGYTQADIRQSLKQQGCVLNKNQVGRILSQPVYAGFVCDLETRELLPGLHEPIVSEADFRNAQHILAGRSWRSVPHNRLNEKFPLRGSLHCAECGAKLTASASKGSHGRYHYYHCARGRHPRLRAEKAHEAFIEQLQALEPDQSEIKLFETILRDAWKAKSGDQEKGRAELLKQKAYIEKTRDKAEDLYINDKLPEDIIRRKRKQYAQDLQKIAVELDRMAGKGDDMEACVSYSMRVLYDLSGFWERGKLTAKQRLQDIVFPDGLVFGESGFRTPRTSSLFRGLQAVKAPTATVGSP